MTRRFIAVLLFAIPPVATLAQEPKQPEQKQQKPAEQEPPEEDESLKPKEYTFNPLQAENELKIGNFYFKKGSYRAASKRYEEATRWNPSYAEAYLKWGESLEKLNNTKAATTAYVKYLELAPDAKNAADIRKKIKGKS